MRQQSFLDIFDNNNTLTFDGYRRKEVEKILKAHHIIYDDIYEEDGVIFVKVKIDVQEKADAGAN